MTEETSPAWRKSRRSYSSGGCVEAASWRKPSRSVNNGACVETGTGSAGVYVRDTTDRGGPMLAFTAGAWTRFAQAVRSGNVPGSREESR